VIAAARAMALYRSFHEIALGSVVFVPVESVVRKGIRGAEGLRLVGLPGRIPYFVRGRGGSRITRHGENLSAAGSIAPLAVAALSNEPVLG